MVTIHATEEDAIRARGGSVLNGLLITEDGCTFKTDEHLCGLHFTDDKPFGCIASPFTLNARDCLIVRNRYRRLVCYNTPEALPTYQAFRASIDLIFGTAEARGICMALDRAMERDPDEEPLRFLPAYMPLRSYRMLHDNDATKKSQKSSP